MAFKMITDEEKEMLSIMELYGRVVLYSDSTGRIEKCGISGTPTTSENFSYSWRWNHEAYGVDPDVPSIEECFQALEGVVWSTVEVMESLWKDQLL